MAKRPLESDIDNVWHRNKSKIQRRYHNHTVKELKKMMEQDEGFPAKALTTWHEKLHELGIRKNVSADEWRMIYREILPKLEDPTRELGDLKAKRLKNGLHIEIIVRGRTYSWNEAWKNMKRALLNSDLQSLPKESLDPSEFSIRELANCPTSTNGDWKTEVFSTSPSAHFGRGGNKPMVESAERIWKLCLSRLPIGAVIHYTIDIESLATPSSIFLQGFRQNPSSTDQPTWSSRALNTTENEASTRLHWNLSHQLLSVVFGKPSTGLTTRASQYKHYVELFTIIYFLSNNHTDIALGSSGDPQGSQYGLFRQLDSIFADLSAEYLEELLRRRLASIRAAFEVLVILSGRYKQKQAFKFLVNVGTAYKWLDIYGMSQDLLAFAASMNLKDTLRTLLKSGCDPNSPPTYHYDASEYITTAIVEAVKHGNFDCAKLLLKHCDINRRMRNDTMTNLDYFLLRLAERDNIFEHGLELFIREGLDLNGRVFVDQSYGCETFSGVIHTWHSATRSYNKWSEFSVLDYLFYFHRPLFDEISPSSALAKYGTFSRVGVLLALENGTQNLQQYLKNLVHKIDQRCLEELYEQLILEQFTMFDSKGRKRATDLKIVHALVDSGSITIEALCQLPRLLERFVTGVGKEWPTHEVEALQYLLNNGATVNEKALSRLAQLHDTRPLELVGGGMASPRERQIVLIQAAARNDFATVERLFKVGVDLETDMRYSDDMGRIRTDTDMRYAYYMDRISIIAHVMYSWCEESRDLPKMLALLVTNGAPLRLSARRRHLYHLLHFTIDRSLDLSEQDLLGTVEYIVDAGCDPRHSSFPSASLLEACYRASRSGGIQVFEYLFRRGARLRPGSPLTTWICLDGGIGLIREMVNADFNLEAYTTGENLTALQAAAVCWKVDVVEELLRAGANVNAPARGTYGLTALQAACQGEPESSEEQQQKLSTVNILLAKGASVNAGPARTGGLTALQAAAESGDLALTMLLLFRQPKADVNAPPCQRGSFLSPGEREPSKPKGNALDLAAKNGRIDVVKLLLNCNALSHRRGRTGYEGAISHAERQGHLAVADLIRQHAGSSGTGNPHLSEPQRDCREYSYVLGLYENSEYSEEEEAYSGSWKSSEEWTEPHSHDEWPRATALDRFLTYVGSWTSSEEWKESENEANSENETRPVASSDIDQQDQSEAACGLDGYNSTQPPSHDEWPTATAWDGIISSDLENPLAADGGYFADLGNQPYSFQDIGSFSMDFDTWPAFDMGNGAPVQDTTPWVFGQESMDSAASVHPTGRVIEEPEDFE